MYTTADSHASSKYNMIHCPIYMYILQLPVDIYSNLLCALQGVIMVEGPGSMKQMQSLWQDQQQWAFALDIAEGQANAHPSLQLPSLPGLDNGTRCCCLAFHALTAATGLLLWGKGNQCEAYKHKLLFVSLLLTNLPKSSGFSIKLSDVDVVKFTLQCVCCASLAVVRYVCLSVCCLAGRLSVCLSVCVCLCFYLTTWPLVPALLAVCQFNSRFSSHAALMA